MPRFEVRSGSARVAAGPISYLLRPGGEIHVLFLHGLGCGKESFVEAFEGDWFPPGLTLLAPDLPGHGGSHRGAGYSYDLSIQAAELRGFIEAMNARHLVIVAHSMGNICGLELACNLPLLSGYYCIEGNLVASDCKLSARIAKFDQSTFVTKFYPIAHRQFLCPGCAAVGIDPVGLYRSACSLVDHCADDSPLQQFVSLAVPKAYYYGSRNAAMPVLARLSQVETVEAADTGHFLMNDSPGFVWADVGRRISDHLLCP